MAFDSSTFFGSLIVVLLVFYALPIWIVTKITKKNFMEVFKTIFWFWLVQIIITVIAIAIFGLSTGEVNEGINPIMGMIQ